MILSYTSFKIFCVDLTQTSQKLPSPGKMYFKSFHLTKYSFINTLLLQNRYDSVIQLILEMNFFYVLVDKLEINKGLIKKGGWNKQYEHYFTLMHLYCLLEVAPQFLSKQFRECWN